MLTNDYHRLLKRQIEKSSLNILDTSEHVEFLNMVNDAYISFDKDVKHIEHILEESSKELFVVNQKLKRESDSTKTQLQNIIDNLGGVIFETDLEGNFTFLNNAWAIYSGFSIEESLGKNFKYFLKRENIEGHKNFSDIFHEKRKQIKFVFKNEQHNKLMWFEVKSKLIFNNTGIPEGFIGTITDITNLKETEIELKKANRAKDEFLSTMSHEIRTPLNAVTGLTNLLLMESHLPKQTENLKALKYSSEHLLGLINDLLDLDKINSGKLELIEKDFNLHYFLENLRSDTTINCNNKKLEFNLIKGNGLPNNIIGDKLKLTQIIKNLLGNSIKFTKKGSITLRVENLGINRNKVNLEFKVEDTGIGISKDRQQSIFENFTQANSDTFVKYGGSGLGLSISKKLLQLQHSDLKVESSLGKGSTFSFKINYKISNRLNTFEPDMIKMQPIYEPISIRVLVAEDNKMNILILKQFFLKWGVTFDTAENGKVLLDIYQKADFDLILMDLHMPELNGYETTRVIRNLPDIGKANIPIIALTAFAQKDIKRKTERYKMNGFMGKPFNPMELYMLLKEYSELPVNRIVG